MALLTINARFRHGATKRDIHGFLTALVATFGIDKGDGEPQDELRDVLAYGDGRVFGEVRFNPEVENRPSLVRGRLACCHGVWDCVQCKTGTYGV